MAQIEKTSVKIWQTLRKQPRTQPQKRRDKLQMRQRTSAVRHMIISLMIALTLASGTSAASSNASVADSVVVAGADLDSLFVQIDSLMLENSLYRIDLEELARRSYVDSVLLEDRLKIQAMGYEAIVESYEKDRDSWFVRAMKHPVLDAVFFMLGAYAGLSATASLK